MMISELGNSPAALDPNRGQAAAPFERRRCCRYPLSLPVCLERLGRRSIMAHGSTVNISSQGALLAVKIRAAAKVGRRANFQVRLSGPARGGPVVDLACTGRVVRIEETMGELHASRTIERLAVTLERYEFQRTPEWPPAEP